MHLINIVSQLRGLSSLLLSTQYTSIGLNNEKGLVHLMQS